MKIYKITFKEVDYDQYDSFVVVAESKDMVEVLLKKEHPGRKYFSSINWDGGFTIEELLIDKNEIVLGSFNAG